MSSFRFILFLCIFSMHSLLVLEMRVSLTGKITLRFQDSLRNMFDTCFQFFFQFVNTEKDELYHELSLRLTQKF